jgi:Tol biopolymer transport system component
LTQNRRFPNGFYRKITGRASLILAVLLVVGLVLVACGDEPPPPAQVHVDLPGDATATPPFPARAATATPTVTSDAARAFTSPPPLFPTNTVPPTPRLPDFTATASVPDANLTPTAVPTGQLAYIQAGNLWVIDDTGSNRRQLTDSADISSDAPLAWDLTNDKLVYVSRAGELWSVDLQGKRTLVFSPARSAKLGTSAKLPPLPTALPVTPDAVTPRPATNSAPVKNGPQVSGLAWSPDGRYVAFNFYAGESGLLASSEVWVADLLTDKAALTRIGEGFGPTWAPDSRTLAYLSRGEVRNGPARPTPEQTPQGTAPLTPTRTGNAQSLSEVDAPTTPPAVTPSPTSFILRPGATGTPSPGDNGGVLGGSTPAGTPTPTLNLVALPSPTPTPTYPPVFLGNYVANRLVTYNLTSKKSTVLLESDKLPDAFVDTSNLLRSYVPAPLQAAWWSPDGRYIALADRLSVVGVIAVAGNSGPVIWTGLPQGFTVYDLEWLPRSDGVFMRYGNPYNDNTSRIMLVTFNANGTAPGVSGDVTNRGLIRIDVLPGATASCPALTPGGNLFSYYDGAALVITRPDGSIYSTYSDAQCPAWAPFGRNFATIRKNTDGALVLNSLDQLQPRILISARAVERVFWLRSDPSYLGGQATAPAANPPATATPRP